VTTNALALDHIHFDVDDDGVAVALLDRRGEAVNALSIPLMLDFEKVVSRVEEDAAIVGLVIGSAKPGNFLAGADIRWLQSLREPAHAMELVREAHRVFARVENLHMRSGKPVVAAIHGACLGGGMEMALTCSARIASDGPTTQLGQPEVKLGVIPAGGGTQRLPRLVGIATALDLMMTGRSVRPRSALKMGLVDELCPSEVLRDAAKARVLADLAGDDADHRTRGGLSMRRLRDAALEGNPLGRKVLFSRAKQAALAETKGNYPAPLAVLRVVEVGAKEGIDAGYAAEIDEFSHLVVSPEAKSLIGIFFDTTSSKKDTGVDSSVDPRHIDKVAVVGGGLMGGGIAAVNTTRAGVRTRIKELDDAGVARGLAYVRTVVDGQVERRRIPERDGARLMQLVSGSTDYVGFGDADLVIEAVFEDLALKHTVLKDIEGIVPPETIFASNTSSIPLTAIAEASSRPETVIGMHYFSPVEKMPLLEIIATEHTADWVTATCVAFGKQQGKNVIVVNDGPGFYTSRIISPYVNEVGHMLGEGVRIEAIDAAMVDWGFPVGPVTLADEVGIDVGAKVAKVMQDAFGPRLDPAEAFSRLLDDDRRGRKNGRGFYLYEDGKRGGVDESVYAAMGVGGRTHMDRAIIQDRLALQMINEAVRCLEEGILRSARDGDLGAVYGLGFPPFRGGPFRHIDTVGAGAVVAKLDAYAADHGPRYEPAGMLRRYAAEGQRFREEE
jgi:3-hydroxyacyl-CoA dehydrogenase/enoyl-CoA hydratase/3-hydroxybutyryl-CoA epimerase